MFLYITSSTKKPGSDVVKLKPITFVKNRNKPDYRLTSYEIMIGIDIDAGAAYPGEGILWPQ